MISPFISEELDLDITRGPGYPKHVLNVRLGTNRYPVSVLRRVHFTNSSPRDVLILSKPCCRQLPTAFQAKLNQFSAEADDFAKTNNLKVPTAWNILAEHTRSSNDPFSSKTLTVVNRYGIAPALILGKDKDQTGKPLFVAALPGARIDFSAETRYPDDESAQLLSSISNNLPIILTSYQEQIAYYLQAIFLGANDRQILKYCTIAKDILEISLGRILDMLFNPQGSLTSRVAERLRSDYASELCSGHASLTLGHLVLEIVNTNYGVSYFKRPLPSDKSLPTPNLDEEGINSDTIFLQSCIAHIGAHKKDFVRRMQALPELEQSDWLKSFGLASCFAAEIKRSSDKLTEMLPRAFMGYHFNVAHSKLFYAAWCAHPNTPSIEILRGRGLTDDILWSVLALVWMSDHQLLFIPDNFRGSNGNIRPLRERDDWVIQEVLYGSFITIPFTTIVSNANSLAAIRGQLKHYTHNLEISQVDANDWAAFIQNKEKLALSLGQVRYVDYPEQAQISDAEMRRCEAILDDKLSRQQIVATSQSLQLQIAELPEPDKVNKLLREMSRMTDAFWSRIADQVVYYSVRNFLTSMVFAWASTFHSDAWSIIRCLLRKENVQGSFRIRVEDFIRELRINEGNPNSDLEWCKSVNDSDLAARILTFLESLAKSAFISAKFPSVMVIESVQIEGVHELLVNSGWGSVEVRLKGDFPLLNVVEILSDVRQELESFNSVRRGIE